MYGGQGGGLAIGCNKLTNQDQEVAGRTRRSWGSDAISSDVKQGSRFLYLIFDGTFITSS